MCEYLLMYLFLFARVSCFKWPPVVTQKPNAKASRDTYRIQYIYFNMKGIFFSEKNSRGGNKDSGPFWRETNNDPERLPLVLWGPKHF